jgi:hypothetical protein
MPSAQGRAMGNDLIWYDSIWLGKYIAAREIIARVAPARMGEFSNAMAVLRTDPGFSARYLPGVLDKAELERIREAARAIPRDKLEMHELKRFGRFVVHDWPVFTELQHSLTEQVSEWAGEEVEPSYNFFSSYTQKGVCEPHLDAPSAKWTLDICLDQSVAWPIHFSPILPWPEQKPDLGEEWQEQIKRDSGIAFTSETTMPGDAILFSGSSQWHYRDPIPHAAGRTFCDLLFLHYIPKGAAELVQPANWARLFDIPELAGIPGIDRRM